MEILVVDDETPHPFVLERMLAPLGGKCTHAMNGKKALTLFSKAMGPKGGFDLVFVDDEVGGVEGLEIIHRMRAAERQRGVRPRYEAVMVLLSEGMSEDELITTTSARHATRALTKPVLQYQLVNLLRHYALLPRIETEELPAEEP